MKGIFLRKYYESLMTKSVPYTQTSEIRKSLIEEYEKKLLDSGWKLCISEGGVVSPDLTTIFYTCRQPYIGQIMSYSVDHKAFRRCIKTLLQSGDFIEVK